MLRRMFVPAIAVAVFFVANSAQDAQAFGLLDKMLGGHHGHGCCEPACCAPEPACCAPEPVCCAPEPVCCAPEPSCCDPCASCCRKVHFPRLRAFFDRLCNPCCQPSCCEPACCEPVCEPACCY